MTISLYIVSYLCCSLSIEEPGARITAYYNKGKSCVVKMLLRHIFTDTHQHTIIYHPRYSLVLTCWKVVQAQREFLIMFHINVFVHRDQFMQILGSHDYQFNRYVRLIISIREIVLR